MARSSSVLTPAVERAATNDQRLAQQQCSAAQRLEFLDALRGIAATTVVIGHGIERAWPDVTTVIFSRLHLGHAAVTLFFICSGFIIPMSLAHSGSLREFWIRRVLRLYPLYWTSILIALLLQFGLGNPAIEPAALSSPFLPTLLANLTMLQSVFGYPDLRGLFWTLSIEMQFYILVSFLFQLRLLERTLALAVGFLGAGLALELLLNTIPGGGMGHNFLFYIGMMFVGTNFYQLNRAQIRRRSLGGLLLFTGICLLVLTPVSGNGGVQMARAVAFVVFSGCFLLRRQRFPAWLLYLGLISYSLYLMHSFAFRIPVSGLAPLASQATWLGGAILLAATSYALVERPAIRLGRRLT